MLLLEIKIYSIFLKRKKLNRINKMIVVGSPPRAVTSLALVGWIGLQYWAWYILSHPSWVYNSSIIYWTTKGYEILMI